MREYPLYEQRRNLDRQAGLTSQTSGKKRKHEDEDNKSKDKEEKSKHKKEKKKEEDPVQKEEAEEKLRKKESKNLEEEKPSYLKKEDDEYHSSKKEDKYRYTRPEESKVKYSRRDDDDRARYNKEEHRYRYRRDEDERYDDRPKYEPREDKYLDSRCKYDRDEGKLKTLKKPDSGKSDGKMAVSKSEPPPKPYNPPKIFCGPSPAMKAKLRKQNVETGKTTPVTPLFGKFTWKKKENLLATEAQKAAAEFIKDDEAADEECLAKSVAAAKEIAQKLATMQNTPPPWVSNSTNQGKLHSNLPAPSAGFKLPSTVDKPAPLNTSQTMRPPNANLSPQCDGTIFPVPVASNPDNSIRPQNPTSNSSPEVLVKPHCGPRTSAGPQQLQASVVPPHSKPSVAEAPPGSKPSGAEAPSASKPLPKVSSLHQVIKTSTFEVNSAPRVSEPTPSQAKPVGSESKPSPCAVRSAPPEPACLTMVTNVSDVAAPGVPESEQTHTVFIKPPPFITLGDGAPKSEKPKRNLAAAKAQDLFGIFYSSTSLSGSFSITRPAKDDRRDDGSVDKNQPQNLLLQPQNLAPPLPQPPPAVLQPGPDGSEEPQTKTELDIKIASVWSLQSTQDPEPGTSYSKTTSQTLQPELSQPGQPEDQNISPNQSQSLHPDSIIATQNSPSGQDTTQKEPESQPQAAQDDQPSLQPDISSDPTPASEPKPGSKARGKANSRRRTSPASGPAHQTRSQTRYQSRQQNQPEQDLMPGDSGSAASDSELLDTSDPGSEPQPEAAEVQEMEIIPESLGLPADMTSLDFESGFNFE